MELSEAYNLTQKDFEVARTSKMESLSRAIKAECELLPSVGDAPSSTGYSSSGYLSKSDDLFRMIKELHQHLTNNQFDSYSPTTVAIEKASC